MTSGDKAVLQVKAAQPGHLHPGDKARCVVDLLGLKISSDQNAAVAGLPSGYLQKVIGSRPVKRIGAKSFGPILGLLGVRLLMIVDAEACERYGKRLRTRAESLVRDKAWHVVLTRKFLQKAGRKGGLARTENLTPAEAAQGSVPARPHTGSKVYSARHRIAETPVPQGLLALVCSRRARLFAETPVPLRFPYVCSGRTPRTARRSTW